MEYGLDSEPGKKIIVLKILVGKVENLINVYRIDDSIVIINL